MQLNELHEKSFTYNLSFYPYWAIIWSFSNVLKCLMNGVRIPILLFLRMYKNPVIASPLSNSKSHDPKIMLLLFLNCKKIDIISKKTILLAKSLFE